MCLVDRAVWNMITDGIHSFLGFGPDVTPQSLVQALESNTNIIFALSPKQSLAYSLASEFSLILPPPGTPLVSHFPERDTPATIIPITVPSNPILSPSIEGKKVWFSGISHALGNNPLLVPVLNAPAESFAADSTEDASGGVVVDAAEKGGEGLWAGSMMGVVSGFQTRDSARVMWVGGVELFSDEFAKKEITKFVSAQSFISFLRILIMSCAGVKSRPTNSSR